MKKFISAILSASILTAFMAVPVFADYTAPENSYDVEQFKYTYDDGTVTNDIDSSNAKQITEEERLIELEDNMLMTKEFFLSFDFRFDSAQDGTVPGYIGIDRKKSSGAMDKQGPLFSYGEGNLRTATGKDSYQSIAPISPDTWYTAELEGKMVVSDASVVMRIYDASHQEVTTLEGVLNLRQFWAGASNGYPDCMRANNVSMDNVRLISENPDTITITAATDEVKAGQTDALDYSMSRLDKTMTKYDVQWAVYDESNTNEITDGSVTVSSEGILSAAISSPSQTVTVRATAEFAGKELSGTKAITIKSVDTSGEKFDTVTLSGDDTVKAGTSSQEYTFAAFKDSVDVTDQVTKEDVVWSVYNCDDLKLNGNTAITVQDGILTVGEGVLPQKIYIRATSPSGNVYGSKPVNIEASDNQKENLLLADACETAVATADRNTISVDGSSAYYTNAATNFPFSNSGDYTLTEFDIKFGTGDEPLTGGVRFKRNDGTENSSFVINNGILAQQTGGSNYSTIYSDVKGDTWYHLQILYSSANDAAINVYQYNENGTMELVKTATQINKRNSKAYDKLEVSANTYIDNIKVTNPLADSITVTAPGQYIFAGGTAQITASALRSGMPLGSIADLEWAVLDAEQLPIIDGSVTINEDGLLTVDAMAPAQTITVRASTPNGTSDSVDITIQTSEIFTVTNIGVNEAKDKIVKLYVDKSFYYSDDVTFIIAIKDAEGTLKAVKTIKTFGDRLSIGSNELTTELNLPAEFDPDTYSIQAMVWTNF